MDEATLKERLQRSIRRPFFLIFTPDKTGSYFEKQIFRVLTSPREPISGFLAPATLGDAGTDKQGRTIQQINYDLSACTGEIEQMEALPLSLVDAFERAAKAFIAGNERSVDHEIKLRRGFRLPDPDIDPQAYYVYGPAENRQLIILWGAEIKQDSSLPLLPEAGYEGPTILQRLRARIMGPSSMRNEALKLLDRSSHPFARFIAAEVRGGDGKLRELVSMGKRIPVSKLKRMKYLPKAEIEAFETAAREYIESAYPEAEGISEYEKQLRTCLRLPDILSCPQAYYRNGKQLLIACSPGDDYDACIHPVADIKLGIPTEETDANGHRIVPPTVAERLDSRATPVKLYTAAAVITALVAVGLAGLLVAMLDHKAPALVDNKVSTIEKVSATTHRDTPGRIRLVFDEDIAPESLAPANADAHKTFYLIDEDGRPIDISKTELKGNVIDLFLSEGHLMKDGRRYKLEMSNLSDASINKNKIKDGTRVEFEYNDTVPPLPANISAEGSDSRKLRIEFSEPLDKFTAENPGNYQIDDFTIVKAEYDENAQSVILTCERRNQNVVDRGFVDGGQYRITVNNGISDASAKRNRQEAPTTVNFKYVDTVAPRIAVAKAVQQTELNVVFTEPVALESVKADAFTITHKGEPVAVRSAKLMADSTTVSVTTEPLFNGREYQLEARMIADLKGNAISPDEASTDSFHFDGREDKTPPQIATAEFIKEEGNRTKIRVQFNEGIDKASAAAGNFQVQSFSRNLPVADVQASTLDEREMVLVLGVPANDGENLYVRATNVVDLLGNRALLLKSAQFMPRGTSTQMLPSDLVGMGCSLNGPDSIALVFNENLDAQSAKNPANYFYSGNAKVQSVTFDAARPNRVILTLSEPVAQSGQTVTAHSLCLENDAPQKQSAVVFKF